MKRQLNYVAIVILVLALPLLGAGVHFLHGYQVRHQASALIAQADQAKQDKSLTRERDYLRRYLGFRPSDTPVFARYAQLVACDELTKTPRETLFALSVLDNVLVRDPSLTTERELAAKLALRLAMHKDAALHLDYLLKDDPENGKLLAQLAECHLARGFFPDARDAYERAIRHAPGEIDPVIGLSRLLREQTDEVLRRGKDVKVKETPASVHQLADSLLDKFITANPKVARGYLARAQHRRRYLPSNDANQQAIEADFRQSLTLAPDDAEVLLGLAEFAVDRRDYRQARELLETTKTKHPTEWRAYLALARIERAENRSDEALAHLRAGLDKLPAQLELLWEAAELRVSLGDAEAAQAIQSLKDNGFPQPERDLLTARLRIRESKWGEALQLLVAANAGLGSRPNLSRSPFSVNLRDQCERLLIQCYSQLGDLQRAHIVYLRMMGRDPRSLEARFGVARTHAALGRVREAERQYNQMLALANGQYARVELARLALRRNLGQEKPDWDEVDRLLESANELRPLPLEVALLRAEAHAARKQYAEARTILQAQLIGGSPLPLGLLRPEGVLLAALMPPRQLALVYVGLSALEERAGSAAEALAWLDKGQARLGRLADFHEARIRYWSRQRETEAATALAGLKRDLKSFTADEQRILRRALAVAYTRINRRDQARELWQELASENPDDWGARLVLFNQALEQNDTAAMATQLGELKRIESEDGVLWREASIRKLLASAANSKGGEQAKDQLSEARKLTTEIAARWPGWIGVTLFEAQIDDLDGNAERALQKYRAVIDGGGATVLAVRRAIDLLNARMRFREAQALMNRFPRLGEGTEEFDRYAARLALRANDNADALARAERAAANKNSDYRDHLFLAQMAWVNGQTEKATASLAKARQLNPDAPEVWVMSLSLLVATGKTEEARKELKSALPRLDTPTNRLALAQCYEIVGDRENADKVYALPELAATPELLKRRAVASYLLRTGQPKAAENHLKYLIDTGEKSDPATAQWAKGMMAVLVATRGNHADTREAIAKLEGTGGSAGAKVFARRTQAVLLATRGNAPDRREAISLLEALADEGAEQPQDRQLLAQLLEANNEWPRARKQWQLLRSQPGGNTSEVLAGYIAAMLRNGEMDAAEEALALLKKNPGASDSLEVLALQAQILHRRDRKTDAVRMLKTYATKRGQSFGQVAAVLESLKEYTSAEEMYRAHAEKSPNPAALLAHAGFLGRRKRSKEALDVCQRAWAKAPPAVVIDTCLGILEAADDDEALRDRVEKQFQEYLKKEPKSTEIRLAMANLRVLQRQYDEAERLYIVLINENRNDLLARNNLAWLLASQNQRVADAEKWIAEAIRVGGQLALLLDTQAVVLLASGKTREAIRILEQLVRDSPKEATYLLHLAQAYAADENRTAADQTLLRARQAGLDSNTLHPLERKGYDRLVGELADKRVLKE